MYITEQVNSHISFIDVICMKYSNVYLDVG